ncbi:MAG: TlyA family RNA methyltransferase [Pseudomonadota bacterium]
MVTGKVYLGEVKLDKPGHLVASDVEITMREAEHNWVSRGGMKLAHAIEEFKLEVKGKIGLDIGSSTGGFTDVLLFHGASKVYSVDVGHGQLDWKLRQNPHVVVMEKTNARSLTSEIIDCTPQIIVCDASFISLKTVLPASLALASKDAILVALIKPQFEVGKANVGKGGVVRDSSLHQQVCEEIRIWLEEQNWQVAGITTSPITGPKGNIEFLIVARNTGKNSGQKLT